MENKTFVVTIEVDQDTKTVKIKDSRDPDAIKEYDGGVHLVAADGKSFTYYVMSYGKASELGWALAAAFNDAWKTQPYIQRLFSHFTEWIGRFLGDIPDGDEDDIEAILDKWEEEDIDRDKQEKEPKKDRLN